MHGGGRTGPRTGAGRKRCAAANWKHGDYATEAVNKRQVQLRSVRAAVRIINDRFSDAAELNMLLRRMRGG
jgi:hypothetical protein